MMKTLYCLIFFFSTFSSLAQINVLSEDFEGGVNFTTTGGPTNQFLQATCAGNGPSNGGINALYVSSPGIISACSPGGTTSYGYNNAPSGIETCYAYFNVQGTCGESGTYSFDYKLNSTDLAELVYSTDGGTSWTIIQNLSSTAGAWTTVSAALPPVLNYTDFIIGFRFTYDNVNNTGEPLAVDNFSITLQDNQNPNLICPPDYNVYLDVNCQGQTPDFSTILTFSDNCTSFSNLTTSQTIPTGTVFSGHLTVQNIGFTVTDESLNSTTCNFNMRFLDTLPASITCPGAQNAFADANCQAIAADYTSLVSFSDNCATGMFATQSPAPGATINDGETITMTLQSAIPNSLPTCSFTVNLIDTIRPNVACPALGNFYVDNSCQYMLGDYTGSIIWTDNCETSFSNMSVSQNPPSGTLVNIGNSQPLLITLTDPSGNAQTCSSFFNVLDTIRPSLTCPPNQTDFRDVNCLVSVKNYVPLASGSDNCSSNANLTWVQTPSPTTVISADTPVTIELTDEYGNSSTCVFQLQLVDSMSPTITCPTGQNVAASTSCDYSLIDFTALASANDNCTSGSSLVFSQSPAIGATIPAGTSFVTLTATDASGNSGSCQFPVNVIDQTAPTINCPVNQQVIGNSTCLGILGNYTSLASVSDNCSNSSSILVTQFPFPNATFTQSQSVTLTAEDQAGNTSTCIFDVLVLDTFPPTANCPNNQDIAINANCEYTIPDLTGNVSVSDNCSSFSNISISQVPAPGSLENGITVLTFTIQDQQNNSTTCTTTLTPIDNTAPAITCPGDQTVNNGVSCDYVLPYYGTMAPVLDNCPDFSITQVPAQGSTVQAGDQLITLTAIDAGGNSASCSFTVSIIESVPPTISCPSDFSTCDSVVTYTLPTFGDNCAVSLMQTDGSGLQSGSTFPVGVTTLSYQAVDSSGNTASCSFNIEVFDSPSVANIPLDTLFVCDQNSALISAVEPTGGSGTWNLVSGNCTFNNVGSASTGINNLILGQTVVAWVVNSAQCGQTSDTLVIFNNQAPSQALVVDTLVSCSTNDVLINANNPFVGTGFWSTPSGLNITNTSSNSTFVVDAPTGWSQVIWNISQPGCPTNSDTIHLYVGSGLSIAQGDTSVCWPLENPINLVVNAQPGTQINWSFTSGNGLFSTTTGTSTNLTSLGYGENTITASIDAGECPTSTANIKIISTLCSDYSPVIPTVMTPDFDGKNDVFEIQYLNLIYPECYVIIFNRWGSVMFESTGYEIPWDGTYKGEPVPMGTYFYRVELRDENQQIFKGSISIIH